MRWALIGLLASSIVACASHSEQRLNSLYDSAAAQLWRGELTNASRGASEGIGLTRVLGYQAVDALARGAVTQVLPGAAREDIPVHLLYPGGAHPAPKLRAFIDMAAPKLRTRLAEIERALGA